jgi:clathrin heavy chain
LIHDSQNSYFHPLPPGIEDFDAIDQIAVAQQLERHELLEMRRIAALLYSKNKRYKQAIDLSKQDKIYQDAMQTARDSGNTELCQDLVKFFIEDKSDKECFTACLYTCYDLLKPDFVMELAWKNNMMDAAMPFLIQAVKEFTGKIETLTKKEKEKEESADKEKSATNDLGGPMVGGPGMFGNGQLAIGNLNPLIISEMIRFLKG